MADFLTNLAQFAKEGQAWNNPTWAKIQQEQQLVDQKLQQQRALQDLAMRYSQGNVGPMGPQKALGLDDLIAQGSIITGDIGPLASLAAAREKDRAEQQRRSQLLGVLLGGGMPTAGVSPPDGSAPLNVRNNNPGNMRPVGSGEGFQKFNSPEEGLAAMANDLTAKITGNSPAMAARFGQNYSPTLRNVITTWAPPEENDTANYIDFVSKKTGISPDQVLSPMDIQKIMPAMIEMEGGDKASTFFGKEIGQPAQPEQPAAPVPSQPVNPALQTAKALAMLDPEQYADDYIQAQLEAQNPEPTTDIGKMQRDEQLGLVPQGSTQNLIEQKNRQLEKEKAEEKAAQEAAKRSEEQEKVTRKVADQKIGEAFKLLRTGGQNVGGLSATASLVLPGKATDPDKLNSIYSTLKSVISLDKLMEMKKASPTGASGFGALSAPELQLLVDSVAALDPELPIETQYENLKTISNILGYGQKPNWSDDKEKRYQELLSKRGG